MINPYPFVFILIYCLLLMATMLLATEILNTLMTPDKQCLPHARVLLETQRFWLEVFIVVVLIADFGTNLSFLTKL